MGYFIIFFASFFSASFLYKVFFASGSTKISSIRKKTDNAVSFNKLAFLNERFSSRERSFTNSYKKSNTIEKVRRSNIY